MYKNGNYGGTASNAVNTHSESEQVLRNSENNACLYDLYDLEKIFKVTRRTLFNWHAKNYLPLITIGGKLYLSHDKLMEMITGLEGGV